MIAASGPIVEVDEGTIRALEVFTGSRLPRANVGMLLRDAVTLSSLADRVRDLLGPHLVQTIRAVGASVDGNTAARFVAQTAPFVVTSPAILLQVASIQDQTAEAMRGYAVEMDYLKRQTVIMFSFMMAELAIAAVEAFFSPASAAARVVTTRSIIQTVLRSSLVRIAARSTAMQMLFMPGSALLAQLSQMADGIRSGLDWAVIGKQALYGLSVAALSTAAMPLFARGTGAFGDGLSRLGVKKSWNAPIVGLTTRPAFEISLEVGGGVGASLMVDHKFDTRNAGGDAVSGAVESGTGMAATGLGKGGRRGAHGLGFTPTLPRLRLPGGTAFSSTGQPVLPVDLSTPARSTASDPTAHLSRRSPLPSGAERPGPVPITLGPATTMPVPLVPVPSWVAATDPRVDGWQRFQQDLVDRYGSLTAQFAQAAQAIAALPVPVERMFARWVDSRLDAPAVATLLTGLGLPRSLLTEQYLTGVRNLAVERMTEAVARWGASPQQIMAALPAEFDRQALRSAGQLAAQYQMDRYFDGGTPVPAAVREAVTQQVRLQIDHGLDAILGTAPLLTPGGPVAPHVPTVVNVVQQATGDLPARVASVTHPPGDLPARGDSVPHAPAAGATGIPFGPVTFEQHAVQAAEAARTQFTALAERHDADPVGGGRLAEAFQREWLDGYRATFAPDAGAASHPGPIEIDTERWRPTGEAFDVGGSTMTRPPDGGERVAVRYALTPGPGEWVFEVRLHLTGQPDATLDAVKQATLDGVRRLVNDPRNRLPSVDLPMRVDVRFVDDPGQAFATVVVGAPESRTDQVHWAQGQPPASYAHEVLHFLGALDHRAPRSRRGGPAVADADPSLMGHHHADAELLVTEADLRQIMETLAPHYAGVAGSHGPARRPAGAASAAQGPSSVIAFWDSGVDTPPGMSGQEAVPESGPEPMFTVPGGGSSLLYALIATDPVLVRDVLGPRLDPDLRVFLSDPARVRATVIGLVGSGVPPTSRFGRVTRLLQAHVRHYLDTNAGQLPTEVTGQRFNLREQVEQDVAGHSREQVLGRLRELGQGVSGRGLPVDELGLEDARALLTTALLDSDRPLDPDELFQVGSAVDDWSANWNAPAGAFLAPLLAHATGSRFTILQNVPSSQTGAAEVRPVTGEGHGPAAGRPVTLYRVALDPESPGVYNRYHFNAALPAVTSQPPELTPSSAAPPPSVAPPPAADARLVAMATGLPADLRLQRAVGATLLHDSGTTPDSISSRVPAPTGSGPAILLDPSVLDPATLDAALAGLRAEDATTAVLHWPEGRQVSVARALEFTGQALGEKHSAVFSVPRAALSDLPRPHPRIIPLDADGAVTFFGGRPDRYLFLSDAAAVPPVRTRPYGLPEQSPGVYELGDGWVAWEGDSHLWIGPENMLEAARNALPGGGLLPRDSGVRQEPSVFLGWRGAELPAGVRDQVGRIFGAMPAGAVSRLVTSGIGLDRRAIGLITVHGLPGGVRLSAVPGGVLAHTGPRPAAGAAAVHWSDLTDVGRPRLVLDESVADPAAVVEAVRQALGPERAGTLQVFLAPAHIPTGVSADALADRLRQWFGGTGELVLPASALGRPAAGVAGLIPVDARGRRTFPAAAHTYRVPPGAASYPQLSSLGLPPTSTGALAVGRGWTVEPRDGVILFAETGTNPGTLPAGALATPPNKVAVVVQSGGGPVPREVAAALAEVLSGVPVADQHVRVYGNPESVGRDTPAVPVVPAEPVPMAIPDPRTLPLAGLKADLPDVARIEAALRAEAERRGIEVPPHEWELIRENLFENYQFMVGRDGYLFALGGMEVWIHLNPEDPQLVSNPAGSHDTVAPGPSVDDTEGHATTDDGRFHANQFTQGNFQVGARSQTEGSTMRATRLRLDGTFDVPLSPAAQFGLKGTATINRSDQKTTQIIDAEKGRVVDNREDSTLYSYLPGWSVEARADGWEWEAVDLPAPATGQEPARLVVAVPESLLTAPGTQVTAALPEDLSANGTKLSATFSASNMTGLAQLYDHILRRLEADGFTSVRSVGDPMRRELHRKLWNLDSHLDEAMNNRPGTDPRQEPVDTLGYRFTLHHDGAAAAIIQVYADRGESARVGSTTDKAHIEKVRTAIVGHGGEFTLQQSTGLSFGASGSLPLGDMTKPDTYKEKAGIGLSGRLAGSVTSNDGGGFAQPSLNVMVSRYTGMTGGHEVQFALSADVATSLRPLAGLERTPRVPGSAVVRLPEPDAFDHGFETDADAFRPATDTTTAPAASAQPELVPYQEWRDRLRNIGRHPEDPGGNLVPRHVLEGRGLGQSLVDVDRGVVARLRADLQRELTENGFLVPDGNRPWSRLAEEDPPSPADGERQPLLGERARQNVLVVTDHDRTAEVDNFDLLRKMVSNEGLESHFDTLTQGGMTFTLHTWLNGKMWTAKVTVRAELDVPDSSEGTPEIDPDGNSPYYDRMTDEYHVVNLSMGIGVAGQGANGNQGISAEFGLKINTPPPVKTLRAIDITGISASRNIGASERVSRIVNRPELLEYPGRVSLFKLPYKFSYDVSYSDAGSVTGALASAARSLVAAGDSAPAVRMIRSEPMTGDVRAALLSLNSNPATFSQVDPNDTDAAVLNQSVLYFLDASGLHASAQHQFPGLAGAGQTMAEPLASLTNLIAVQSHFKEALRGEYSTDSLFDSGFLTQTRAALSINVERIHDTRFVGATVDKYVTGLIELYQAEIVNAANWSFSFSGKLPAISLTQKFGKWSVSYGESASVRAGWNASAETKRAGGLEMIKLAFGRAYAFEAQVDYGIRSGRKKELGFVWERSQVPAADRVAGRTMIFLLPEPEALAQHAADRLPVSDVQLTDAMGRWSRGELVLSGNTVAGLLSRWRQEATGRVASDPLDLETHLALHRIQRWAQALVTRHADPEQRGAVLDAQRRARFTTDFGFSLAADVNPFAKLTLPPYMTRTGDRTLGHVGIDEMTLFTDAAAVDGRPRPTTTLLDAVRTQVDAAAPGMLSPSHRNWPEEGADQGVLMLSSDRKAIGILPGGADTLQATMAGQRANALVNDMLHRHNGVTFYLVRRRDALTAEIVMVKLSATLTGRPRYTDWVAEYGIENYKMAIRAFATILGRSLGLSAVLADVGYTGDGKPVPGHASLSFAPQRSRGVKGATQSTDYQAIYDWSGHYRATTDALITVEARRLKMDGRPINNLLVAGWDTLSAQFTGESVPSQSRTEYQAQIDFQVPKGLAEAVAVPRSTTLDLRALPPLPSDVYVSGVLADDLFPAARALMARLLNANANDPAYRGSMALSGLLSRINVDSHLPNALPEGGYLLGSHLFTAGRSNSRVAMRLYASLHSLEIISKIFNSTGTGRYAKFQVTTAATQSRDRWRPNIDAEWSAGRKIADPSTGPQGDRTAKVRFTTGGNRSAPMNLGAGYEDSRRGENHLKMQGPVYLVRVRGRFRLGGVPHRHSVFLPDRGLASMAPEQFGASAASTGWVPGDAYVEMFADEVHEVQRRLTASDQWDGRPPSAWPAPRPNAQSFGLEGLLVRTTPAEMAKAPVAGQTIQAGDFDAGQVAAHTALLIRHELGNHHQPVDPIRLTASTAERARQSLATVLDWAIGHLRTLSDAQRAAAEFDGLVALRDQLPAAGSRRSAAEVRAEEAAATVILDQVARVYPPGSAPPGPNEELEMLGQDPVTVARGVAFELNTHLDLEVTDGATANRYRIDPLGRVVELRQDGGSATPVTPEQVVQGLDPELVRRADAAAIDMAQRVLIYEELLARTPLQPEAAAVLPSELEERIRQARDGADDSARQWLAQSLPDGAGTAPRAARHDSDTADGRAGRARRLLAAGLPPGWTTVGPLPRLPTALRPGTRIWIAREQGAVAARLDIDGSYRLHDPLSPGTPEASLSADQFRELAGAGAVTLVEPDVLTSWLLHDGAWAASRQFAIGNLDVLRADETASNLARALARAQPAPSQGQPARSGPDAPVLNLHHVLLDAIRAGRPEAAYRYLQEGDPGNQHDVLVVAVSGPPPSPLALRALANLAEAASHAAPTAAQQAASRDAGMLRAVADILDPTIGPVATFRAVAAAAYLVDGQGWRQALDSLADQLPEQQARDVTLLRGALDIVARMEYRQIDDLIGDVSRRDAGAAAELDAAAAGLTAADLAKRWRDASDGADLLAALRSRPAETGAGIAAGQPPAAPHHPLPPMFGALDGWRQIPDWGRSRDHLNANRRELLSDRTHRELQRMRVQRPDDTGLAALDAVLTLARYGRVDDAYRYLLGPARPDAPATAEDGPTERDRLLTDLLADPGLSEPAVVAALANLAGSLPGPLAAVNQRILRLTGDMLAGLTVDDVALTNLVRDARGNHSPAQRQRWAGVIRQVGDGATPARGAALRHFADRLHPAASAPAVPDPGVDSTVRQDARQRQQQATHELQRAQDALDQARQRHGDVEQAHRDAVGRLADTEAELRGVEARFSEAGATRARRENELPGLRESVKAAEQWVRDVGQAGTGDQQRPAAAPTALDQARQKLDDAQAALGEATGDIERADSTLRDLRQKMPDLRAQAQDAREDLQARDASLETHDQAVEAFSAAVERARQVAETEAVQALSLPDPPTLSAAPATNVDAALADLARSGYAPSTAVAELARRLLAQHGGTPPTRLVLTADPARPERDAATAAADEVAVLTLDRVRLARDLARILDVMVELRVGDATRPQLRPYLAYPGGEVVRLNATGRPETADDAVRQLPPPIQGDLGVHVGRPEVRDRLEVLHEAQIESLHDFGDGVATLLENVNRYQGYLAYQWAIRPDPPADAAGVRQLANGLSTEVWPVPTGAPPSRALDASRPEDVAAAWLAATTPQQRADLMADLLNADPRSGFAARRPTPRPPNAPPPGTRVVAVAVGAVAVGVVLPGTGLRWYVPARGQLGEGSMQALAAWAAGRVGDNARQDDIWYVEMTPSESAPAPAAQPDQTLAGA
ncbi:hypothetical protein ACH4OY_13965 [Micromonospora rubida]|uniref:Tox-PL domain-containing protein n=1 Tax=Micromonospora rubida TaxID=2697657 RepID=A0ABW7SLK3_9ACTN